MNLVIVHYHLRPGGIRRVIELALPSLAREFGKGIASVAVVSGEAPEANWWAQLCQKLAGLPVTLHVEPAFGYFVEQDLKPEIIRNRVRSALEAIQRGARGVEAVVWAHNLGLGRNVPLIRELTDFCAKRNIRLVAHHHDWWFDNRWERWMDMRQAGIRTLRTASQLMFTGQPNVHHVTINTSDALKLRRVFPGQVTWLPNLTPPMESISAAQIRSGRRWLDDLVKEKAAPIWMLPCRLLRRKNIAEALLLARWLRPEAWLITTAGLSSEAERAYADRLVEAARGQRWRLRLSVLDGCEESTPGLAALLSASETILLTSLLEGFGLPYLEAAALRRPIIARSLPNIAPDLQRFGFRFPQLYSELRVDPRLFDWHAERERQTRQFRAWRESLPFPCRKIVGKPGLLAVASPVPIPFSRLTLTAQLEVLSQPLDLSWELSRPLNPFLAIWRRRAQSGCLHVTRWPRQAAKWLSGEAYARRFRKIVESRTRGTLRADLRIDAQTAFIRERLQPAYLYPLLWNRQT